jgi:uncharacterized protein
MMNVSNRHFNRESHLTVFILALFVVLLITSCGKNEAPKEEAPDLADSDTYTLEVLKDRKMKDLHLVRDESSPLKDSQKENFHELDYFAPDKSYAFYTGIERLDNPEEIVIATSKDRPREMIHIGYLPFTINGNEYKLSVLEPKDKSDGNYWFIPFTDATSGKESYGGGRYIDIENPADSVFLDFNYAYNPYCAYNDRYDCPIPPPENKLPIAILAGEKKFSLGDH